MNSPEQLWHQSILPANAPIRQVIRNPDQIAIQLVMVPNAVGVLGCTITDGEIRRVLL